MNCDLKLHLMYGTGKAKVAVVWGFCQNPGRSDIRCFLATAECIDI